MLYISRANWDSFVGASHMQGTRHLPACRRKGVCSHGHDAQRVGQTIRSCVEHCTCRRMYRGGVQPLMVYRKGRCASDTPPLRQNANQNIIDMAHGCSRPILTVPESGVSMYPHNNSTSKYFFVVFVYPRPRRPSLYTCIPRPSPPSTPLWASRRLLAQGAPRRPPPCTSPPRSPGRIPRRCPLPSPDRSSHASSLISQFRHSTFHVIVLYHEVFHDIS